MSKKDRSRRPVLQAVCIPVDQEKLESIAKEAQFQQAVDVLARTLWGEARGEGQEGMEAVACVILNRVQIAQEKGRYWWGNTVIEVCQKPYQFSCWNSNDPNRDKVLNISDKDIHFVSAKRIAARAIIGSLQDQTMGATHYHEKSIMPYWVRGQKPLVTIGRHVFYRIE